jgi:hypothetical protein
VASGHCQLSIRGRVRVEASKFVAVLVIGTLAEITGGGYVNRVVLDTATAWCEYHGVEVRDGAAILFKGVNDAWESSHRKFLYQPGTMPEAPDWDEGAAECGGGLHFSPTPRHAQFFLDAGGVPKRRWRYVACPVALASIVVHPDGEYPEKVKAPRVSAPCWEVDRDGKRIEGAT